MSYEIKVSVVMPVYNAEKYLQKTLESVSAQSLKEIEIICVNDGSADSSEKIIQEAARKDGRICLLNQENQYAGVARNHGLAHAKGKYVVFWDADDLFDKNALKVMYQKAEKTQADICVCGAKHLNEETGKISAVDGYLNEEWLPSGQTFSKADMPDHIFSFGANVPWNKMYRRAFVQDQGLQFQDLKQANDTYFVMMAFFLAKVITVVKEHLVIYRVENRYSLTGKASETVFCPYESYKRTWEELLKFPEFQGTLRKGFSARFFRGMLHCLSCQSNIESYRLVYDKVKKEGLAYFEVEQLKDEEFDVIWHGRAVRNMQSMSAEDYLMWNMHRCNQVIERDRAIFAKVKKIMNPKAIRFVREKINGVSKNDK